MSTSASAISSAAARTCGIGTVVSLRSQQVDLSFTEPYFLDKNIAAGIDLFAIKTSPTSNFFTGGTPAYQQTSYGGALRAGYQITENLRQTWKYTARSDNITDVASDASLFIQLQAGTRYDLRRSARCCCTTGATTGIDPTDGYYASLGNDFAGVGFGVQYLPQQGQCRLLLFGRAGVGAERSPARPAIFSAGAASRCFLQDRFFVGGDNLRGFAPAGHRPARHRFRRRARRQQSIISARSRSAFRSACRRSWASAGGFLPISARLWSNDQKNIDADPAQLAANGGVQPIVEGYGGDPRQRRGRRLLEIAGRADPSRSGLSVRRRNRSTRRRFFRSVSVRGSDVGHRVRRSPRWSCLAAGLRRASAQAQAQQTPPLPPPRRLPRRP